VGVEAEAGRCLGAAGAVVPAPVLAPAVAGGEIALLCGCCCCCGGCVAAAKGVTAGAGGGGGVAWRTVLVTAGLPCTGSIGDCESGPPCVLEPTDIQSMR
jgi:hypothetical protein